MSKKELLVIVSSNFGLATIFILLIIMFSHVIDPSFLNLEYIERSIDSKIIEDILFLDQSYDCPNGYTNLLKYEYSGNVTFSTNLKLALRPIGIIEQHVYLYEQERGCYCRQEQIMYNKTCSEVKDTICDINIDITEQDEQIFEVYPFDSSEQAFTMCGRYSDGISQSKSSSLNEICEQQGKNQCSDGCVDQSKKCPISDIRILNLIQDSQYIVQNNILHDDSSYTLYTKHNSDYLIVLFHTTKTQTKVLPLSQIKVQKSPFICQSEQEQIDNEKSRGFEQRDYFNCTQDELFREINGSKVKGSSYLIANQKQLPNKLSKLYDRNEYQLFTKSGMILSKQCQDNQSAKQFINSIGSLNDNLQIRFVSTTIMTFLLAVIIIIFSCFIGQNKITPKQFILVILFCVTILILTHLGVFLMFRNYRNTLQAIQDLQCIDKQFHQINQMINFTFNELIFITELQFGNSLISILLFIIIILINFFAQCCFESTLTISKPEKKLPTSIVLTSSLNETKSKHLIKNINDNTQNRNATNTFNNKINNANIINNNHFMLSTNMFSSESIKSEFNNQQNIRIQITS